MWLLVLTFGSPNLRNFPPLNAEKIKNITVYMLTMIPDDIYQEIVSHAK